jgi:hypothetical protein
MIDPVMVCVVLTGMPPIAVPISITAPPSRRRSRRSVAAW